MYYVYELIDPRDGQVFYIGKGKGRRRHDHERDARKGVHSRKCERIRSIFADGMAVRHRIVSRHDDENEALQAEADAIAAIGLERLTNVMPGGIMGQLAYLAAVERANERAKACRRQVWGDALPTLAPKLARAFRLKQETGGFGMQVGDTWFESSGVIERFAADLVAAVGIDAVRDALAPYGVRVAS